MKNVRKPNQCVENKDFLTLSCQDPVFANGKIKRFDIRIQNQKDKVKNGSWESVSVNRSDSSSGQQQHNTHFSKVEPPPASRTRKSMQ